MTEKLLTGALSLNTTKPEHGQDIRKDSRGREVVPLYRLERNQGKFLLLFFSSNDFSFRIIK